MTAALRPTPSTTRQPRPELELCATMGCGAPFPPDEGFGGVCDACWARETEHLAGDHATPDPECRFCE